MDQKSQKNLSPELKAVYDRVMNTKISARPGAPAPIPVGPRPATQNAPIPAVKPLLQTEVISDAQQTATEPAPLQKPEQVTAPQVVQEPKPATAPDLSPIEPSQDSSSTFLSSLPPRPLNSISDQPFVFTGGKSTSPDPKKEEPKEEQKTDATAAQAAPSKVSGKIIMGLLVVFLVVYSLFWAKIFNIF